MEARLIRSWKEMNMLGEQWNALLTKSDCDTIFLTWEWVWSWCLIRQDRISPYIVVVYDEQNKLVGIAPFYQVKMRFLKVLPFVGLRVMGDPDSGTEYLNIIANTDKSLQIRNLIFNQLACKFRDWDCLWVPQLAGWTEGYRSLIEALEDCRELTYMQRQKDFSAIELGDSESVRKRIHSGNLGSNLRRVRNGINKKGKISFSICTDSDEIPVYLNALKILHKQRWQLKGEAGAFVQQPMMSLFYEKIASIALENKWLYLAKLSCDGNAKAVQIGYVYNNAFYVIQEGFDPGFHAGAGNILRAWILEDCLEKGIEEYDFLGGFTEHKRRWGATPKDGFDLIVWNKKWRTIMFKIKNVWPTGKYLKFI